MRSGRRGATFVALALVLFGAACDARPGAQSDARAAVPGDGRAAVPGDGRAAVPGDGRAAVPGDATTFPGAIGLAAARDPSLADRIRMTTGGAARRELARQAVRESQVLLKNDDDVLPLARGGKIFVAGPSADDLGRQGASGGTTILQGIREVAGKDTTIAYDRTGAGIDRTYRAAVAVLGGRTLDAQVLARLRAAGVPVIAVLVSGRPVDVSSAVGDWAAFVAAWLPGSEGAGVADVLFGDYPPTGRLPVAWPRSAGERERAGDELYAYGYGLGFAEPVADAAPPSVPGTPIATAGELRWTASTDPGGSGVDGYDVFRDGALIGVPSGLSYPLGALAPGVRHEFTVVARDKAGNRSAASTPLVIDVPIPGGCKARHGPCVAT